MNKTTLIKLLSIAIVTVIISSCGSSKQATIPSQAEDRQTLDLRYDALVTTYGEWENVYVPIKLQLTEPSKFSISGRMRMIKGKSIDISLRMLGFEIGRIFASADSVYAIDKINKRYLAEALPSIINNVLPASAEVIQDMLIGRAFIIKKGTLDQTMRNDVKLTSDSINMAWFIKPIVQINEGEAYGFRANATNNIDLFAAGSSTIGVVATCAYSGHIDIDNVGIVASNIFIDIMTIKKSTKAEIKWSWDDAKWNQEITSATFSIPKGYKRLNGTDILKMFNTTTKE